jgi:outer membrane biosynthesis protein TonB
MKNTLKNSIIAIAIISAPLATFAAKDTASQKAFDLPTYTVEDIASLPEPIKNPIPSVKSQFVGMSVQVKFTVTAEGRPESVRLEKPLSSYSDVHQMTFASQLENAVKDWKFAPGMDKNGSAIPVKVIMPVQVVEKSGNPAALASLTLDTSKDPS